MASQTSKSEDEKIGPVIDSSMSPLDEVQWFTDLGLGRGVDATKVNLWKEKSSFQVQSISKSMNNLTLTDEGGAHNYYEREISSITSRQAQLKVSVEDPNTAIHVGMDTLDSKSMSKSKRSVGEQVITRTISFSNDFDDLPLQLIDDKVLERRVEYIGIRPHLKLAQPAQSVSTEIDSVVLKSFEEKLSEWLLNRIRGRRETLESSIFEESTDSVTKINSSAARLSKYLNINAGQECFQEVVKDCLLFLEATGVTHYVHSIQLGAMKFRVFTSTGYNKTVGAKGSLGVEKVAKASLESKTSSQKKSSSLSVKAIGKMTDGTVKRGTLDEAVIGFKLLPIPRLVRSYHVNEALKRALRDYIIKRAIRSKGPFLMSCGSEKMRLYWKVEDNDTIVATPDVEIASIFFLTSTDDVSHPNEFAIAYYGENENALMRPKGTLDPMSKEQRLAPLPLYLNGTASMFGFNDGPLEVIPNIKEENARFVLHSRVHNGYEPVDFNLWMLGEEFFVNCSRRRFRWDGYLAVKKKPKVLVFATAIVPSQSYHNGVDTWLLFRLMPVQYRKVPSLAAPLEGTDDDKSES